MSHFAQLDENNVVTNIVIGNNDHPSGDEGYQELLDVLGGTLMKTSYNSRGGDRVDPNTGEVTVVGGGFRKNYAVIGGTYDPDRDAFLWPKPFPSWILNEDTCLWEAPVLKPDNDKVYFWDEESQTWNIHPLDQ